VLEIIGLETADIASGQGITREKLYPGSTHAIIKYGAFFPEDFKYQMLQAGGLEELKKEISQFAQQRKKGKTGKTPLPPTAQKENIATTKTTAGPRAGGQLDLRKKVSSKEVVLAKLKSQELKPQDTATKSAAHNLIVAMGADKRLDQECRAVVLQIAGDTVSEKFRRYRARLGQDAQLLLDKKIITKQDAAALIEAMKKHLASQEQILSNAYPLIEEAIKRIKAAERQLKTKAAKTESQDAGKKEIAEACHTVILALGTEQRLEDEFNRRISSVEAGTLAQKLRMFYEAEFITALRLLAKRKIIKPGEEYNLIINEVNTHLRMRAQINAELATASQNATHIQERPRGLAAALLKGTKAGEELDKQRARRPRQAQKKQAKSTSARRRRTEQRPTTQRTNQIPKTPGIPAHGRTTGTIDAAA
jgi:hypothetical protein